MVFDLDSQPFIPREVARALRHSPALQNSIPPQPEVIVQVRSRMLLHAEGKSRLLCFVGMPSTWLCCDAEVAHRAIARKLLVDRVGSRACTDRAVLGCFLFARARLLCRF